MKKSKRNRYLFRGTTLGWPGNEANRDIPRTPVTTHPIKAVLFALCCKGNNRVIYINTLNNISNLKASNNVLAPIEDEIAFEIQPIDYAKTCVGFIIVEDAIKILKELNQEIPQILDRTLFDMALKDVKKMDIEIIKQPYQKAELYLRKA